MGQMKADMPSVTDMNRMFEDAAYWNRYDQTTPFGNVEWNDDRTAMTQTIPEWMWPMMGSQMGLQYAALNELMGWFGGSPYDFGFGDESSTPWGSRGGSGGSGNTGDTGGRRSPRRRDTSAKSFTSDFTDYQEWQDLYEAMGIDYGKNEGWETTGNWSENNLVPQWFAETRHGEDPDAYAAWFAMDRLGIDPEAIFGPSGRKAGWTSDDLPEDLWEILAAETGESFNPGVRRPRRRVEDGRNAESEGDTTTGPPGWPYGGGMSGGPWDSYGGREPEMFWSEDIPNLEWLLNWDEIPDLPTLDQFNEDRERITREMYEQGYSLMQPQLEEGEAKRRQSLADRGIPIGAEIGMAEMGDWGRTKGRALSDLSFSSMMGGYDEAAREFGLGLQSYGTGLQGELARLGAANQARNQAWGERMGVRGQKFNELASILGMMPTQTTGTSQQPYNFNPNIDTMGGYNINTQREMFNTGLLNQWMDNIFSMIGFL